MSLQQMTMPVEVIVGPRHYTDQMTVQAQGEDQHDDPNGGHGKKVWLKEADNAVSLVLVLHTFRHVRIKKAIHCYTRHHLLAFLDSHC